MSVGERRDADREIVQAIRSGDRTGLASAYDREAGAVLGVATKVLRDRALAEEVTQTVFLELWQRPERFDASRGSLRAYLVAIAHRRSVDVIRSEEARRRREEQDGRAEVMDADLPDSVGVEVREAVQALPEREREALFAAYWGGLTYAEAAVQLGVPAGTIKTRIRTALRRLRQELAVDEGPALGGRAP